MVAARDREAVSKAERKAVAKRISTVCSELMALLRTAPEQAKGEAPASQDTEAESAALHRKMVGRVATTVARGMTVRPHHIEVAVLHRFGIDITGMMATLEGPFRDSLATYRSALDSIREVDPVGFERWRCGAGA